MSQIVHDDGSGDETDIFQQPEHKLYMRFQSIFKGLPKEMFINRIIQCAASSAADLENQRSMLFELIKECEEFSNGLQANSNAEFVRDMATLWPPNLRTIFILLCRC